MKGLKYIIIIILVVCIILLSTIIIFLKNSSQEDDDIIEEDSNLLPQYEVEIGTNKVTNRNKYFATERIFNSYLNYVKYLNCSIEDLKVVITEDTNEEELLNSYREDSINVLSNMINASYIEDYSITQEQILENLSKFSTRDIQIDSMYMQEVSSRINVFFIFAYAQDNLEEFKTMIITDSFNSSFTILPEEYMDAMNISEEKISSLQLEFDISEIEVNDYNKFSYINISNDAMAITYFNDYKKNLQNSERLYNTLNPEYREKKFGSLEDYDRYKQANYDELMSAELDKYQIVENDGLDQYVCVDKNGKYYIFTENSIMDYTLVLDTYTMDIPQFLEKYNSATDKQKVELNIQKVFEALNEKDYSYVYNKLADSFKSNNFNTQEEFTNYITTRIFESNTVEYDTLEIESGYYTYIMNLTDASQQSSETKQITIIMELQEETDFVIAFDIE